MSQRPDLKRYDFYGGPKPLGDLWNLSRGSVTMRCAVFTHSRGWELRLSNGASRLRSEVCRSEAEVFTMSDAWQAEAKAKGFE